MTKLAIGDRVQVINHPDKAYMWKSGKVVHVGSGFKPVPDPAKEKLPKLPEEPYYTVELDGGTELENLKNSQLRKL
jgi:hypothetical protein